MSIEDGGKQYNNYQSPPPKIANPGPLGLSGFALTTFVLSIHNAGSSDVPTANVVLGLALFYGGLVQLLAGMWEFKTGNTFGATAFSSYGGFWLSFAYLVITMTPTTVTEHAIGIYLLGWTIFTFLLFIASFRTTAGIMVLFLFLDLTFLFLCIGAFTATTTTVPTKIGGVLGIITALIAWYNALAGLLADHGITLPNYDLKKTD
ncbi:putative Membrane protein [Gigaspora margarita]|uniref:Putative Membrane protein n=1 Tax=Gigaspora margarita TaxID=4874 RepID=A0A8H3WZZ7_GIGMA|nr:putative Membrane protein [Gigaspora margarita]